MAININEDTWIECGYISASSLHDDVVPDLLYGDQARDLTIEWYEQEYRAENGLSPDDPLPDDWCDNYDAEEIEVIGALDGVKYVSSWLGGALHFFIFYSPYVTDKAEKGSPCVPGAGILDNLSRDVTAYDVPPDWRIESGE